MAGADGLVIGIEAIGKALVIEPVLIVERPQHKGLEEPRRVRQVPLGRARIVHCLDDLIFVAEWTCNVSGKLSGVE